MKRLDMASAAYYTGCGYKNHRPHFLDSCFLCHKTLTKNHDIFMYRGNTPFCSQECRQEQIEMDETTERKLKISSSKRSKSVRHELNSESTEVGCETKKAAVRTGTVAAVA